MIEIKSNIKVIVQGKLDQIRELKRNPDPIIRTVALTVMSALKKRVHVDGLDATGSKIGTYSKGYMVVRTGNFKNADRYQRGARTGQNKNAGVFTKKGSTFFTQQDEETVTGKKAFVKIENQRIPRPKYNRTSDTSVILSLTRQMENDLSVVATGTGYGIGYLNPFNMQKAMWCEETYKKKILSKLTIGELELAQTTAQEFTAQYLKQTA